MKTFTLMTEHHKGSFPHSQPIVIFVEGTLEEAGLSSVVQSSAY